MNPNRSSWAVAASLLSLCLVPGYGAQEKPVKFAVLGDVHIGLRGADYGLKMTASSERLFEMTVDQINRMEDMSFVVFDGDLVTNDESFNYARFKEIADGLKVPYFVVLGNHDQPILPPTDAWDPNRRAFYPGETKEAIAATFRGHGFGPDGRTWWSADFNGLHLIGLDAEHVQSGSGIIPPIELEWLKDDLTAAKTKRTLVFLHQNLFESFPEFHLWEGLMVENREEVNRMLLSFPLVSAAISAHSHFSDFKTEGGIQYFTTPSIETYPLRFAVFELTSQSIRMQTYPVAQGLADQAEIASIRKRSREQLPNAPDWFAAFTEGLKLQGKPADRKSVEAALWKVFEANPSSPPLPLRGISPR